MKAYRPPGQLAQLHEQFIDAAHRPMSFDDLPLKAKEPIPIIVAVNKWQQNKDPNSLTKAFKFRRGEDKVRFVTEILEYEEQVQHHAEIFITEDTVSLRLVTKDIEQVTERDREHATYCDALFKDIVYAP